jgi:predicted rRNA methylase YqxC with S4 and FtsJ domains
MLLTYSQRSSKVNSTVFNNIVEQLKPDKNMATAFKTIFEVAEEKAEKRGIEKGITTGVTEFKRQTIIRLITTTQWENTQIAKIVDAPIALVEAIRLSLKKAK